MRLACAPARRQGRCGSAETMSDRRDDAGPQRQGRTLRPSRFILYYIPNADKGAVSPLRYRALPYSPFHGFPDMFRLRDYAMVVPPRPARASFAISMEVMMAWRPFPAFMKSMEASILGSMEPAENWPSFA